MLLEWRDKLAWLQEKDIHVSSVIDWEWIRKVKIEERVTPYLTKVFEQGGVRLTCTSWRRLFHIQESVYKELCIDYLTTARFRKRNEDDDTRNFTFLLGGACESVV